LVQLAVLYDGLAKAVAYLLKHISVEVEIGMLPEIRPAKGSFQGETVLNP
jgi:hypothetical protein